MLPITGQVDRNEAPSAPGVRKFLKKVRETGLLMDNRSHPRARPVRTAEIIAAVAQSVSENLRTSTLHRAQQLNVSRTSLRRILHKDLGLFASKLQLIQQPLEFRRSTRTFYNTNSNSSHRNSFAMAKLQSSLLRKDASRGI
ncbi:hypothetical protein NQ318_003197 [Aromia moschata]|uniref:Uncharacterized protein n=1 Tax=Aromia moschata TaxID=1265417 RepID=A0AAV8YFL5_9CUCU|nr:hypothetical protein NQ318_003197 [Aromia moschata]